MKPFETDRSIPGELLTNNQEGETIIARLTDKKNVEFFHSDYNKTKPLVIIQNLGWFSIKDTKNRRDIIVTLDEFRWMLNAQYDLQNANK